MAWPRPHPRSLETSLVSELHHLPLEIPASKHVHSHEVACLPSGPCCSTHLVTGSGPESDNLPKQRRHTIHISSYMPKLERLSEGEESGDNLDACQGNIESGPLSYPLGMRFF